MAERKSYVLGKVLAMSYPCFSLRGAALEPKAGHQDIFFHTRALREKRFFYARVKYNVLNVLFINNKAERLIKTTRTMGRTLPGHFMQCPDHGCIASYSWS